MRSGIKKFYDIIKEMQSDMLSSILDYARGFNYHPLIRYNKREDSLCFKNHNDEWVDASAADIWLIAEIADSVYARALLVDMAYIHKYSVYLEYDECNDSLILKLDDKEVREDECPWDLNTILDKILLNN